MLNEAALRATIWIALGAPPISALIFTVHGEILNPMQIFFFMYMYWYQTCQTGTEYCNHRDHESRTRRQTGTFMTELKWIHVQNNAEAEVSKNCSRSAERRDKIASSVSDHQSSESGAASIKSRVMNKAETVAFTCTTVKHSADNTNELSHSRSCHKVVTS